MEILLDSLEKTGLLTTVGGPTALVIAAFKLLQRDKHVLHYLSPFIQVFFIIAGYMVFFGWRIETPPTVTILLFSMGSVVVSVCATFVLRRYVPSHLYFGQITKFQDVNNQSLLRIFFVWILGFGVGFFTLVLSINGKECTNPRCMGHEFIWGAKGYVGSFWIPTFAMCAINTFVLFAIFVAKRRRN